MTELKLMKIWNWILNILIVVFLIIVIYMFLARIFGNSPTDFQLISGSFGLVGMIVVKLFTLIYGINREVGEIKTELRVGVRSGFKKIKNDIQEIKELVKRRKR